MARVIPSWPALRELIVITCRNRGVHDEQAQSEICNRVHADVTRARSKDAFTSDNIIKAVKAAISPYRAN